MTEYNFITFDVEFWFEGYLSRSILIDDEIKDRNRDVKIFQKILDLLDRYKAKSTCFVLGRFAKEHSKLIKEISNRGHEIGSHGFDHKPIEYWLENGGKKAFINDLKKSQQLLQDITGKPVVGHRATSWSVSNDNCSWVYDALIEEGILYDSSLFPSSLHPYGNSSMPRKMQKIIHKNGSIYLFPAQTFSLFGVRLPTLGGFYSRVMPNIINKAIVRLLGKNYTKMVYFHPYDFDTDCPKYDGPLLFNLMRRVGLHRPFPFLEWYLSNYKTISLQQYCENYNAIKIR